MIKAADIPDVGTKVRLILKDIFQQEFSVEGKISRPLFQHGYDCAGGAWALYPEHGDTPCFKFGLIPNRKRKEVVISVIDVVSIEIRKNGAEPKDN